MTHFCACDLYRFKVFIDINVVRGQKRPTRGLHKATVYLSLSAKTTRGSIGFKICIFCFFSYY